MIKEINTKDIYFDEPISHDDKFYYDEENNEYFIEDIEKSKFYFNLKGDIHRKNKPAILYFNGGQVWVENGKWHRLDGYANQGSFLSYFYIKGIYFPIEDFAKETKHLICLNCKEFCKQNCF